MLKQFRTQYALNNNQYCKTINSAVDVLTNHSWDDTYYENKKKRRQQQNNNNTKSSNSNSNNTNTNTNTNNNDKESFAQKGNKGKPICYCCGKEHFVTECKDKDKVPRSEWFANKSMQMYANNDNNNNNLGTTNNSNNSTNTNTNNNNSDSSNNNSNSNTTTNNNNNKQLKWSGLQLYQHNNFNLDNSIILDSGSTFSSIKNKNLLFNINKAKHPINMKTNAGNNLITHDGNFLGL